MNGSSEARQVGFCILTTFFFEFLQFGQFGLHGHAELMRNATQVEQMLRLVIAACVVGELAALRASHRSNFKLLPLLKQYNYIHMSLIGLFGSFLCLFLSTSSLNGLNRRLHCDARFKDRSVSIHRVVIRSFSISVSCSFFPLSPPPLIPSSSYSSSKLFIRQKERKKGEKKNRPSTCRPPPSYSAPAFRTDISLPPLFFFPPSFRNMN